MEKVQDILKFEREKKGISYSDLSKITKIAKSTLQRYETGTTSKIPLDALMKIAKALNVPPAKLMGWDEETTRCSKIPVFHKITSKSLFENEIADYLAYSEELAQKGEYFAFLVSDDSMEPRIQRNDMVILHRQSDAQSEDLVLVMAEDHIACLKMLIRQESGIMLVPFNSNYAPTFYTNQDVEAIPVEIVGKAIELRSRF